MHDEFNETATGSNNGDSGSHSVDLYWANTSLIGETVNMSKADIMAEIDAGDTGLGAYSGSISVDAEAGNAAPVLLVQGVMLVKKSHTN